MASRARRGSPGRRAAAGRDPDTVRLLAVSKTRPPSASARPTALGQRAFGENYVQEAAAKREALADLADIEWHLIGPLQGNKAAQAADVFDAVETSTGSKIAERLSAARSAGPHAARRAACRSTSAARRRKAASRRARR